MRWGTAILLASTAACDGVFNLDHVTLAGDAPSIEPLSCMSPAITPGDYSSLTPVIDGYSNPSLNATQDLMILDVAGQLYSSTYSGTWSQPMAIAELNDPDRYVTLSSMSYDGLSLYFLSRPINTSDYFLPYQSTRMATDLPWEPPTAVEFPSVFLGGDVVFGVPNAVGKRVMVSHGTNGHFHLAEVVLVGGTWTLVDTAAALYPPGTDLSDASSQLSPDGCVVIFSRLDRNVSTIDHDVMFSVRGADDKFGPAMKLHTNASAINEQRPWLAPDGTTLYYQDAGQVWRATRN